MNTRALLASLWGILCVSSVSAAIDVSLAAEIRLGKALPPPPPEVVVVDEPAHSGPPPWAPAHGFRRNRDYYYYPAANVYYRPADRMWFHLDGRDWRVGVSLPTSIHIDFDRSVSLTMETDRPFEFHEQVRSYYPADYFVSRVRVKEKGGKPIEARDAPDRFRGDERDRDDHGKGKGKGKNKT